MKTTLHSCPACGNEYSAADNPLIVRALNRFDAAQRKGLDEIISLRASNNGLREALEELSGWVDRAIVPTFNRRKPMPENGRKTMEQARAALNNTKP